MKLGDKIGSLLGDDDDYKPKNPNISTENEGFYKSAPATSSYSNYSQGARDLFGEDDGDLFGTVSGKPKETRPVKAGREERLIQTTVQAKISLLMPVEFNDVMGITELYKKGKIISLNFQNSDRPEMIRILDFCAGMAHFSNGTMRRVSEDVYMLVQNGIQIAPESLKAVMQGDKDND